MHIDYQRFFEETIRSRKQAAMPKLGLIPRLRRMMAHPNWGKVQGHAKQLGTYATDAAAISYGVPLAYNMATGEPAEGGTRAMMAAAAMPLAFSSRARRWARRNLKAPLLTASALDATQQATMGHSVLRPDQVRKAMEGERDTMIADGIDALAKFVDNPGKYLERRPPVVDSGNTAAARPPFWS